MFRAIGIRHCLNTEGILKVLPPLILKLLHLCFGELFFRIGGFIKIVQHLGANFTSIITLLLEALDRLNTLVIAIFPGFQ